MIGLCPGVPASCSRRHCSYFTYLGIAWLGVEARQYELVSLVVALVRGGGALLAAVAGFTAAVVTGIGAQATLAQVEIERKPVLVLNGDLESLTELHARKEEPPRNMLFLSPRVRKSSISIRLFQR